MNKILFILLLNLIGFHGLFAQNEFYIKGKTFIKNELIILKKFNPETLSYEPIQKIKIDRSGKFDLKEKFTGPNLYRVDLGEKFFLVLAIDHIGIIEIIHEEKKTKVTGSEATTRMRNFRTDFQSLQEEYFGKLKQELDAAMEKNDQKKLKELQLEIDQKLPLFIKDFEGMVTNLGSAIEAYYAIQMLDFNKNLGFIESRLKVFQQKSPELGVTKALEKQVYQAKTTAIGKIPPHFEATTKSGETINLKDFEGKIVLLDFWATWCRACRLENPKIAAIYQKYKNQQFKVISISQDEDKGKWEKGIKKDDISDFIHVYDSDLSISNLYSVSSLPQNFLLNENGEIIAKNINSEELVKLLGEILQ